jgi:predicted O-methyltransferase YrrM
VAGLLAGEDRPGATAASAGIADYLAHVRAAEKFETNLLPLGEGVAVSVRL